MAIDRCVAQAASARAGGRGSAASRVRAPVDEVKKHTEPQKGIVGSHAYKTVQRRIT